MEAEKRKLAGIAALFFALTAVLYGLLIFLWMPRGQLAKYPSAAAQWLKGELTGERLVDFSPLYLRLHILAQQTSRHPVELISGVHVLCSAVSVSILFLLLARYFRLWIALAGTTAFLLDGSIIEYLQAFEPEPVLMLLMLLFAWLVTAEGTRRHLLAGIVLGLAVWTRPNFLPVAAVVPFYFYFNHGSKRLLFSTALFLVPVLVLLAALWIRNTTILGYFSPVVMNPGTAYFEGNNPSSWGFSSVYPPLVDELAKMHPGEADYQHATYRLIARKTTGKPLTVPEVNSYWTGLAIHYLQDHPGRALKLFGTKIFHFFHSYQWHDITNAFWNEQWLTAHYFPSVPFGIISALAVLGLIAGIARWRVLLLFYAIFLAQLAFVTVIYVSARQRVSVLWVFILFACVAVEFATAGRRKMLLAGGLVVLLTAVLQIRTDLMTEETRLWLSIRRSNLLLGECFRLRSEDQLAEAAAASAASLASAPFYMDNRRPANLPFPPMGFPAFAAAQLKPSDASTLFDESVLLLESGNAQAAEAAMQGVVDTGFRIKRDFYQSSEPLYYMARAAVLRGDRQKAVSLLREAEARSPGDPSTLALLYVLVRNEEDARILIRYFGELDARFYIGRAAVTAGEGALAVPNLEYVCRLLPDYRRARLYLAAALGMVGRAEEGVAEYRAAMRLGGDPVMLEEKSVALFALLSNQHPRDAFALYSYGVVLRQFGRYSEALEVQKRALALQPAASIQNEIAALEKAIAGLHNQEAGPNRP